MQLDYFLKSYDVEGIDYIRGVAFQGSYGIFDRYIDTFMEMKKNGKGAVRATAKLFLNSLYGKFGMNPIKEEKIIDYQENTFSTISTTEKNIINLNISLKHAYDELVEYDVNGKRVR